MIYSFRKEKRFSVLGLTLTLTKVKSVPERSLTEMGRLLWEQGDNREKEAERGERWETLGDGT